MAQVLVEQAVDFLARRLGVGLQLHQPPDFGVRHVERPALGDEGQLLGMLGRVDAVVVGGARRRGQQALRFVEADGFDADAGALCEFADFHDEAWLGGTTLKHTPYALQGGEQLLLLRRGERGGAGHFEAGLLALLAGFGALAAMAFSVMDAFLHGLLADLGAVFQ